jgi:formylglycine-generating enzyme required for sulfatase activity
MILSELKVIGSLPASSVCSHSHFTREIPFLSTHLNHTHYNTSPEHNPQGPSTGKHRVVRGGVWSSFGVDIRSTARNYYSPGYWAHFVGFRCVRSQSTTVNSTPTGLTESLIKNSAILSVNSADDVTDEILIPAGNFRMGCSSSDTHCYDNEYPRHTVYLDAYYIDKYEVTNSLYQTCVAAGVCDRPRSTSSDTRDRYYENPTYANYPVIHITWVQANTFCIWAEKRLPTEAEWEKAARGPLISAELMFIYPWGNLAPNRTLLNYAGNERDTTTVGSYPAGESFYGVMDMAGNVWEWTADWYASNYYNGSPANNPQGPNAGEHRVLRGGSWINIDNDVRSTYRGYRDPERWNTSRLGFRCARSQ